MTDVVVGYRSVMVYVDPLADGADEVERRLREIASAVTPGDAVPGPLVDVPVCYAASMGPISATSRRSASAPSTR